MRELLYTKQTPESLLQWCMQQERNRQQTDSPENDLEPRHCSELNGSLKLNGSRGMGH